MPLGALLMLAFITLSSMRVGAVDYSDGDTEADYSDGDTEAEQSDGNAIDYGDGATRIKLSLHEGCNATSDERWFSCRYACTCTHWRVRVRAVNPRTLLRSDLVHDNNCPGTSNCAVYLVNRGLTRVPKLGALQCARDIRVRQC